MATYSETLTESLDLALTLTDNRAFETVTDAVAFSLTLTEHYISNLKNILETSDELSSIADLSLSLTEDLGFDEGIGILWRYALADGLSIDETLLVDRESALRLVEALVLSGECSSLLEAVEALADAIALGDVTKSPLKEFLTDELSLTLALVDLVAANKALVENLLFGSTLNASFVATAVCNDEAVLSGSLATALAAVNTLEDGIAFGFVLKVEDQEFLAWVMNTETQAVSTYTNYPFNSFAEIGGAYYGCTDTGIYELAGDTDAGTDIDAAIRTGLLDFGTPRQKRMDSMYLGYNASGTLVLKMVSTDGGIKRERHYELTQAADNVRDGRFKLEKGRKSRYWGFELSNLDGADFDLESVEFVPLVLSRRLK